MESECLKEHARHVEGIHSDSFAATYHIGTLFRRHNTNETAAIPLEFRGQHTVVARA